jgi:hypothetical protein
MAATSPYCTADDVAFLLTMSRGGKPVEYGPNTVPTEELVDHLISVIAGKIDVAYMSAGYRVPFEDKSGETWPTAQTAFLKFFNEVGVAAYMGGNVAVPPVTAPGRPAVGQSIYQQEWENLTTAVTNIAERDRRPTVALLRAETYPDTAAEWRLSVSQPATSDFLEGYYDPTRYDLFHAFTVRMKAWYQDKELVSPESPEYMWTLHNRLGYTYAA